VERRAGSYTDVVVLLIYIYIYIYILHDVVVLLKRFTNIDCVIYDIYRLLIAAYCFRVEKLYSPSRRQTAFAHRSRYLMTISPSLGTSRDEFFWIRRCVSSGTFAACSVLYVLILRRCVAPGGGARSIAVFKRLVLFRRSDIIIARQVGRAGTSTSGDGVSATICIFVILFSAPSCHLGAHDCHYY